jgi:hypothetical protein
MANSSALNWTCKSISEFAFRFPKQSPIWSDGHKELRALNLKVSRWNHQISTPILQNTLRACPPPSLQFSWASRACLHWIFSVSATYTTLRRTRLAPIDRRTLLTYIERRALYIPYQTWSQKRHGRIFDGRTCAAVSLRTKAHCAVARPIPAPQRFYFLQRRGLRAAIRQTAANDFCFLFCGSMDSNLAYIYND